MELGSDWILVSTCKYDYVLFVNIESSNSCCPIIRCSLKVLNDLTVECFDSNQRRDSSELTWLLGESNRLTRWSQLPNICTHLSNTCQTLTAIPTTDEHVNVVKDRFKQLIHVSKNDEGNDDNSQLEFRLKYMLKRLADHKTQSKTLKKLSTLTK